jgi:hypothetical protein
MISGYDNVVHLSLIEIRTHNISGDMHVQAVPITTKVACSNAAHGEVCSIIELYLKYYKVKQMLNGYG